MTSTITTDDTTPVSQRVIEKVAAATDTDPLELEPLYTRIDPDCLDGLFDSDSSSALRTEGKVTFRMADCRVVVEADGSVDVTPPSEQMEPAPVGGHAAMSSNTAELPD